jgi:hypothetical protein
VDVGTDILNFTRLRWFDAREGMAKNVIEDVIDPRAA